MQNKISRYLFPPFQNSQIKQSFIFHSFQQLLFSIGNSMNKPEERCNKNPEITQQQSYPYPWPKYNLHCLLSAEVVCCSMLTTSVRVGYFQDTWSRVLNIINNVDNEAEDERARRTFSEHNILLVGSDTVVHRHLQQGEGAKLRIHLY